MARERLGGAATVVRLGDGVAERIDGVAGAGRRAEFIRAAVLEKLDGRFEIGSSSGAAAVVADVVKALGAVPRSADEVAAGIAAQPVTRAVSPDVSARVKAARDEFYAERGEVLLAAVRKRPMTVADAELELDWAPMLVEKISRQLYARGLIHFPRGAGLMVAAE